MTEERPDYVSDALEMIGEGYDHPSIEIHPETTVIRRRGKKLVEEKVPSQVHISTSFKAELATIEAPALKVWLYIALSLNRITEEAFPGLATIAKGCNLSENTVVKYIRELESGGLLSVHRNNRKVNIYTVPEYAFAKLQTTSNFAVGDETTSIGEQTTSDSDQTTSNCGQTTSPRVRSNHINHINQKEPLREKPVIKGIDAAIYSGREVTEEDIELTSGGEVERTLLALDAGLRMNCPRNPEWQSLARWIIKQGNLDRWISWYMSDDFRRKGAGYLKPSRIKQMWPQAFDAEREVTTYVSDEPQNFTPPPEELKKAFHEKLKLNNG